MLELRHVLSPALTVEKHRLDNGLQVLLLPDRSAPVVSVHTWFRVGSRHEKKGRTGIAHLFEHLMFNQTANLAAGEFDRTMEAAGGETNAATWVDWTFYRDSLPSSQLALALRLEADRMQHLTLTDAQVESEREVVANERRFRVDDDVEGFLSEELWRRAFTVHPYHHPTIGWMEDIHAITTDDARAFYRTYYAPNNATLILVGDFDAAAALREVELRYGPIPAAEIPALHPPTEPLQDGERRASWDKPVLADRAVFAYKTPPQRDPEWLPLLIANEVLLGGHSARLYRELVVKREIATGVHGMLTPLHDPGLLEIFVSMKRGHAAEEAEEIIALELERLTREPPTPQELAKVQARIETDFWSELETADGKAEALGHYETTLGDFRRLADVVPRALAITTEEVRAAAARYLDPKTRTVVVARPSGEDEASEDDGDDEVDA